MIPEFALDNISLIPGSNPMYGLNTLGGALSLTTKSGLSHPGKVARVSFGSFSRKNLTFRWLVNYLPDLEEIISYQQVILLNLVGEIIRTEKFLIFSGKLIKTLILVVLES